MGLLSSRYKREVLYVWMTKKKTSSIGIEKMVRPRTTLGG